MSCAVRGLLPNNPTTIHYWMLTPASGGRPPRLAGRREREDVGRYPLVTTLVAGYTGDNTAGRDYEYTEVGSPVGLPSFLLW